MAKSTTNMQKKIKLAHKVADIIIRAIGALCILCGGAVMIYPFMFAPKERITQIQEVKCSPPESSNNCQIITREDITPIPLSERGWPECLGVGITLITLGAALHIYSIEVYKKITLTKAKNEFELEKFKLERGSEHEKN